MASVYELTLDLSFCLGLFVECDLHPGIACLSPMVGSHVLWPFGRLLTHFIPQWAHASRAFKLFCCQSEVQASVVLGACAKDMCFGHMLWA